MAVIIYPKGYVQKSLDDAAVDRIITAVEKTGHKAARAPPSLDRSRLKADLNRCWYQYESAKYAGGARDQRNAAKKRLAGIAKYASLLRELLDENYKNKPGTSTALFNLAQHYGRPDFCKLERILQELEGSAVHTRDWQYDKSELFPMAARQELLGVFLPGVYAKHFNDPTGGRAPNDPNNINSPYVRFVRAVGKEFGEQFRGNTILDYLYNWGTVKRRVRKSS